MSKTLYTQDLINYLSKNNYLSKKDIIKAITFIFQIITHYTYKKNAINIKNFGKFILTNRNQKKTTHPITRTSYTIPKRKILLCKFNQSMIKKYKN